MSAEVPPDGEHPAPRRARVSTFWLLAGLAMPPGGWIAEMLIGVGVASNACPLVGGPGRPHSFAGESGLLVAITLACLVAVTASGAMSRRHWLAGKHEASEHAHLSRGEGRTRFLAICGMLSAATFAIAILFNLLEPIVIPPCWSAR